MTFNKLKSEKIETLREKYKESIFYAYNEKILQK